jgi:predicted DNA-binding transcriptional regulator YafY
MARPVSDVGVRLRRVLAMVPWLLEAGGSTVADVAERFGVNEDEVVRDLNLVMCCGLPPYGGGDMITVVLDEDGTIEAWPGPFFSRPMQLTPPEGFAVLAAGRALLAVPGSLPAGPLSSALDKLEAALGASGSLAVDLDAPPLLADVRDAVDARERVRVTYYSAWRDELWERVVEPLVVHSRDGRWYVETRDATTAAERRLRVDRIRSLERTGERFTPPDDVAAPTQVFSPGADATDVTLLLPASARWVVETYDTLSVDDLGDGRLRVRLLVAGDRWLERLLLKAGPDARVEAPANLTDLAASAAKRVLSRYR